MVNVREEDIDKIIEEAEVNISTVFNKCTVVCLKLKSGFVITESSSCVDEANYDMGLGTQLCMQRIKNKLFEFEAYVLQKELAKNKEE